MGMPLKIQSFQLISPSIAHFRFGGDGERIKKDVSRKSIPTFSADKSFASASISNCKIWDTSYLVNGGKNRTTICRSQVVADFAPASSAIYGLLLLGGGLFAYKKTRSKGSLLGGLSGATLMAAAWTEGVETSSRINQVSPFLDPAYFLMQAPETKEIGDAVTFGSSLLFASVFGIRYASTRKVIPSALLLAISIGVMTVSASAYLQDKL